MGKNDEQIEWWNAGWKDGYDAGLKDRTKIRQSDIDDNNDICINTETGIDSKKDENKCGCGD